MFTPEILTDTVIEWLDSLDYEYMLLHVVVCYGLYYSQNLRWIVEYFSPVRRKGISKAVWLVGGVLALIEVGRFIPHIESGELLTQKIFSILHSYILIQVFVEYIVEFVHKWIGVIRKSAKRDIEL
jgi:hypothetical protein